MASGSERVVYARLAANVGITIPELGAGMATRDTALLERLDRNMKQTVPAVHNIYLEPRARGSTRA